MTLLTTSPTSCSEIDWDTWTPTDRAVLLFVIDETRGRILLIEKKRGLGAGKVNGPGGRIDAGERAVDAAAREIEEELGVRPVGDIVEHGELSFHFVNDGYKLHCHVFRVGACDGEPIETDEATPLWTNLDTLPFERMWADDALWLPIVIEGKNHFRGRFIFDGDRMVDHVLTTTVL